MGKQRCLGLAAGVFLLLAALVLGQAADPPSTGPAQPPGTGGDLTFALEEVSVFDLDERLMALRMGQYDQCGEAVDARVTYPKLQSEHPLYGAVNFPRNPRPDTAGTYRFVLDESGGTGKGYDRLYLDLNRDGDLTNDKPLGTRPDPDQGTHLSLQRLLPNMQPVCFETVALEVPFDARGSRPLEFMPRLMIRPSTKLLAFVVTKARRGFIQLGGRRYEAILGHGRRVEGWFDNPNVTLHVIPAEDNRSPWRPGHPLGDTRKINNAFYRFSATPTGNKLTVHPYTGPLGRLEVRAGDRDPNSILIAGSLRSATTTVPVGAWTADLFPLEPAASCQLPVGDYQLDSLSLRAGDVSGMILPNYHLDGQPMGKILARNASYSIAIRQDKPFVLEFSKQAQVLFALPARDQRIRPGETLSIKAVLVDPGLDVMYRLLRFGRGVQLDPKVVIKRANGQIVAESTMPFG